MSTAITNIWNWIKANYVITGVIVLAVVILFFGKQVKRLFGGNRIRRRRVTRTVTRIPRSAGRRNKPAQYNNKGKKLKAWQIKGSAAAKRHMAEIRKMR